MDKPLKICSTPNCGLKYHANGLCSRYDKKRRRALDPTVDKRYEKTSKGFLMRLYRNMQSRVTGVQKQKFYLYENKDLLSRDEFYDWAINHPVYCLLFLKWEFNNYNRKMTPSVDRINSEKGYTLDNMEWVTQSENSRRGSLNQHNVKKPNAKRKYKS